ncbi:unnamed protein product [Parascedosporium putredinis]|uniref:Sister chromatid cohesion protein n=1 Tax=Parascedosporium putredinis TaxID=1442378 RepID=A0A9P1H3R5_9PEZI|nr:unnamed protein product [Parascedosporium putredinis]CAI7995030.1 unnamed protein product [Parascedosporium putredinis]
MANTYSGHQNGLSGDVGGHDSKNNVTRAFTLQEALPYSPQTSILPFTPDLIPDPIIGSGMLGAGLADVVLRDEFDNLNRSADAQTSNRKHVKQVADLLIHEIKPKERTDYKFRMIPRVPGAVGVERNPADGLSPLAKAIFDRSPKLLEKPGLTVDLGSNLFNKDEYIEMDIPDSPDAPAHLSTKKRKRDDMLDGDDLLGINIDQRERADAALQDLMKITHEVFTSVGQALSGEMGLNHVVVLNESNEPTLTSSMHQKLQSAIQKPSVSKLCEGSIKDTGHLDLKIDDTWGEPEIAAWVYRIPEIETALKAARTALRIMSGGREDKRLYSEGMIQQCLDLFKRVMDGIVVPIVEIRNSGPPGVMFKLLLPHKKALAPIFTNSQRLFALLSTLVTSIELSESVINTLEFTATQLLFVENAHYEKDSVIGVQRFDGLRLVAMDMLCQIFLMNPGQRQGIFDEILTSLEKLPVGKQSARHFKLADGGSIQPVSALIMRLVQVSAGKLEEEKGRRRNVAQESDDEEPGEAESPQEASTGARLMYTIKSEDGGCEQFDTAIKELSDTVTPLIETTKRNASYVVGFIINRALKSTKSGDTPYRNLLDLFVEDFTTCLDSPDWPAAEILLRFMMIRMVQLSEGEKTAAPAKNMALDVLGTMGAAISRLRSTVRKAASTLDAGDSDDLGRFLAELATSALEQRSRVEYAVSWSGPYRVTLEHLEERCSNDPHLRGSISLVMSDWASKICTGFESLEGREQERDMEFGRLAYRLRMMLGDKRWMSDEYTFKTVSPPTPSLPTPLCYSDPKSEKREPVFQRLLPQVRDSALGLIGKCMSMRPHLEEQLTPRVVDRFMDAGIGPRKRAMKLARDIYLRNKSRSIRVTIASGLLLRVQDPDEGVRDLARQMIEEIWFAPFYSNSEDTPAFQASLTDHVSLMIQVSKAGHASAVLDKVLQSILGPQTKPAEGPFSVCTKLVATMFELINTLDSDDPTIPSGRDALQVLMTFAKAEPKLFTFEQIKLLKPHLSSFTTVEDLHVFRATVVIYRRVLPQLSAVYTQFLWSLVGIQKLRQVPLNAQSIKVFQRYSVIVGMIGKHCDLDSQANLFREKFPKWKGKTVPSLMVDCLLPFATPTALKMPGKRPSMPLVLSEAASAAAAAGNSEAEKKRELTVMGGTNYDDVASATTQRFLKELTRISLASQDDHAFLAIEVLGSINRQGLVHPKETGVALITLQTSSNPKIAEIAYQEYKALHEKHETVLEREYAKAVQSAFAYQRDIAKDVRGATTNPFQAKLHLLMEILKISKSKNRQRFLEKLCQQVDFDFTKMDVQPHLFEYVTVGEVLTTVATMEKIVSGTGAAIAHVIETEIFNVRMDLDPAPSSLPAGADGELESAPTQPALPKLDIDPRRLRQLSAGAMILLCLWEARTYLRRLYGLGTQRRDPKAKAAAKDMSKSPVKVQGITGDKVWEEIASHMTGFDSQETMLRKCRAFVDLLNVDNEFKIAEEDDEMEGDMATPSGDEDEGAAPDRGRKRKGTGTPGNRKKRARSTSRPRPRGRPRKQSMEADADGDAEPDWF